MEMQTLKTAGKHLGLVAGIITSGLVVWKFIVSPIKKAYARKKEKERLITELTKSCCDLRAGLDGLSTKIDKLSEQRENDHKADAAVRTNLYYGQVATITAIRELAAHSGLKINGPVQLYYEQNIEALKTGLGIEDKGG